MESPTGSLKQDILEKIIGLRVSAATSISAFRFNKKRVKVVSEVSDMPESCEGILYWMSRDQRVQGQYCNAFRKKLSC